MVNVPRKRWDRRAMASVRNECETGSVLTAPGGISVVWEISSNQESAAPPRYLKKQHVDFQHEAQPHWSHSLPVERLRKRGRRLSKKKGVPARRVRPKGREYGLSTL